MMRYLVLLFFLFFIAACVRPVALAPPAEAGPPKGTVLTVILEVRPPSDSLYVFGVIRGQGRLRTDYPATQTDELPEGHLLFTFRSADERVLRQTSRPFPGPKTHEVPSEDGTIEQITLPEEIREITLRTQDRGRLKWLDISGTTGKGRSVAQRVDLQTK